MSLRINTNVEAINTLRNLTNAQAMFSKSMEHLSSGKRVNSAADDAAGFAISNKLMAQSNGLDRASANAQDGISMVQTAQGGLQTTMNLLQRVRQLAVQSANDTNTQSDRQALQSEADQINQEITQISTTTQFNSKNLIDGSLGTTGSVASSTITGLSAGSSVTNAGTLATGSYTFAITTAGAAATQGANGAAGGAAVTGATYVGDTTNGLKTNNAGGAGNIGIAAGTYNLTLTGNKGSATISFTAGNASGDTFNTMLAKINAVTAQTGITAATGATGLNLTNGLAGSAAGMTVTGQDNVLKGLGLTATAAGAAVTTNVTTNSIGTDGVATLTNPSGAVTSLSSNGNKFTDATSGFTADLNGASSVSTGTSSLSLTNTGATLQIGANGGQNLQVTVGNMGAQALGVQGATSNKALDISSSTTAASNAIATIDNAIQTVNNTAANLGAVQNRLTAATNLLAIGSQNMQAAYSNITNVNMAQETTNLATAQILNQSSTAMLAQANQAPQGVLKLLG